MRLASAIVVIWNSNDSQHTILAPDSKKVRTITSRVPYPARFALYSTSLCVLPCLLLSSYCSCPTRIGACCS